MLACSPTDVISSTERSWLASHGVPNGTTVASSGVSACLSSLYIGLSLLGRVDKPPPEGTHIQSAGG